MLTSYGVVTDLAAHLVALLLCFALNGSSPATPIRIGGVIPSPRSDEVQHCDEAAIADRPEPDDVQEPRGYKFGEMSEEQANALQGKRIVVRLKIGGEIVGSNGHVSYWCKGDESADRFVKFGAAKAIDVSLTDGRELMVEAKLFMESALKIGDKLGYRAQFFLTDARNVGR